MHIFITLCTFDRGCYFDQFPQLRKIINDEWNNITERFQDVDLDEYVVMPNHFHGIIIRKSGLPQGDAPTLGDIVGAFKSLCVNAWLRVIKADNINARGKFWQNNYYEHVIRDEEEMNRIRRYVVDNPLQWELDRENPTPRKEQKQTEKWMV